MASPTGTEVELKRRVPDLDALMRICNVVERDGGDGRPASAGSHPVQAAQRNIFLDTADSALDKGKFVLRLRHESTPSQSLWFLTLKGPSQKSPDGTLSYVPEEEITIDDDTASIVLENGARAFALLLDDAGCTDKRRALVRAAQDATAGKSIAVAGEFATERTRVAVAFPEGFAGVLELDRVTFPGDQVHYEVEFEVPHGVDPLKAKDAFEALFARANVVGTSAPGKAKRFFAALRGERLP